MFLEKTKKGRHSYLRNLTTVVLFSPEQIEIIDRTMSIRRDYFDKFLSGIDSEYKNPKNGDYVLSVIDGCANLKKFERDAKSGEIRLLSESKNPKHKPIYISSQDNFIVNGKIVNEKVEKMNKDALTVGPEGWLP